MLEEREGLGWKEEAVVVAIIIFVERVKLGWMLSGTEVVAVASSGVALLQMQLRIESVRTSKLDDLLAMEKNARP